MTAPNTETADPSLAEAFGELSEALAASEEGGVAAPPTESDEGAKEADKTEQQTTQPEKDESKEQEQPPGQEQPAEQQPATDQALPERQPLNYTVDGQSRAFDGGFIIPGHGAIISNDALPRLQDRLQQADRLVAQNQVLYQQTQEYTKLGGRAGFDKLVAEKAMLDASATLLLKALSDENTLVALATDPIARQQLIKEIHLTAREAQQLAQRTASEAVARDTQQSTIASQTQTAIHNAVGYLAQNFQGLTEQDIATVRSHAARMHAAIVRPATPDEAREANVQVGSPIIDLNLLGSLLEDRHAIRQSVSQQLERLQDAALENAARAQAAAPTTVVPNGKPLPNRDPANGRFTATPARQNQTPLDQMSSAELTRAMKSGRIYDLILDDDNDE